MKRIIICSDGTMNTDTQTTRGGEQDFDIFSPGYLICLLLFLVPAVYIYNSLPFFQTSSYWFIKALAFTILFTVAVLCANNLFMFMLVISKGRSKAKNMNTVRNLIYRFYAKRGSRTPSHVGKIMRAVRPFATEEDDTVIPQVIFYDKGIGTGGLSDAIIGGGFGAGIKTNVLDCYNFIVQNYEDDDELFFFGFSRGAFTVRILSGLITTCGLLTKGDSHYGPEAYEVFKLQATNKKGKKELLKAFREGKFEDGKRYSNRNQMVRDIKIRFLGVWDTVPAIGLASMLGKVGGWLGRHLRMNNYTLSKNVEYAYHALGLDENRRAFTPLLWEARPKYEPGDEEINKEMEQRWFAGVHTTIGGGFKRDELSYITLKWMVEKARALGLQFMDEKFEDNWNHTLKTYLDFYMPTESSHKSHMYRNSFFDYLFEGLWKKRKVTLENREQNEHIDDSVYARIKDVPLYGQRRWLVAEIPPKKM